MITYEIVTKKNINKYYNEINDLMETCFDDNERQSLIPLFNSNLGEIYVFKIEDIIIGFVALINSNRISHILYFGVDSKYRNRGYGSYILKTIIKIKKENNIIGDLEEFNNDVKNNDVIDKRNKFYEKNGFKKTSIIYYWHDVKYRIFSTKNITDHEFYMFWKSAGKLDDIY